MSQKKEKEVADKIYSEMVGRPGFNMNKFLVEVQKLLIKRALHDSLGVKERASQKLGIARTTLVEKIRRWLPKELK